MDRAPFNNRFATLSDAQQQILPLIAKRYTIKAIASECGVTESAVNQRIKGLKHKLGVNSLTELSEIYAIYSNGDGQTTCRKTAYRNKQVFEDVVSTDSSSPEGAVPLLTFADPIAVSIGSPWEESNRIIVVPEVLNGANGLWIRGALIVLIALLVFAAIIVGLGAAKGLSSARSSWYSASDDQPQ